LKPGEAGANPIPDITKSSFQDQDALDLELRDFVKHVRNRTRPAVSGEEGRRALDVALQVVEQINSNRHRIEQILAEEGHSDLLSSSRH
jgi:predicted dehydrogenase